MELNSEQIGNRIRAIRMKNKISQEELADICGINKGTLCKLENGERDPSVPTVYKLAKGLNVLVSDILDLHTEYIEERTDDFLMDELLKYMKKLDEAEQNMVLEMVRNFVRLKQRKAGQAWQAENE